MDFGDLRTFCQLAEDGNYRIASEHLHITQSALTKKIQHLEAFCGVVLFERGRQGASLTAAGITLLPEARRIVSSFESYNSLTQRVAKGIAGNLNIGFGISSYHLAPDYIAKFKKGTQRFILHSTIYHLKSSRRRCFWGSYQEKIARGM